MCRLLSNATNNINQIARKVNGNGDLYAEVIADLQAKYEKLWAQTKVILKKLATM